MSEFAAHKAFEEAAERHEHGGGGHGDEHQPRHGATWVPIAAAILAVVTAVFSLLVAQRSTESLVAKNETLLQTTRATDAYNEYEARSIKQHIYEAQLAAGNARDPGALRAIAEHEKSAGKPAFANAKRFEQRAAEENQRSANLLTSVMTMEVGVTLLDIAIVLVSISAIVTTRVLTVAAVVGVVAGVALCIAGLLRA